MSAAGWIVLAGVLTGVACGLVGSFLVLRRMAMLGDAISHAVLPGIAVAFLITHSRQSVTMLIGAALVGLLTVFIVDVLQRRGRLQHDASIGVTFTFLFALGVILISVFGRYVDLDQDCVLFGEIAFVPWDTWMIGGTDLGPRAVWSLGAALIVNILFILLFYKELKIISFDPVLARSLGVPVTAIHYGLMGCVALTTVAAFESVGAILVVAMLVVPAAAAYLLSEKLWRMIALSALIGGASALLGFFSAAALDVSISGMMATAAGALFTMTFTFHLLRKRMRTREIAESPTVQHS
ncbi:metal ABC transporter permease [bacterium]|nr:metal ABC transporter permease [bacterium]MBU1984151.1 metal ABC transporter permease [bacterium]